MGLTTYLEKGDEMSYEQRANGSSKAGPRGAVLSLITLALVACGETSQSDDAVNGVAGRSGGLSTDETQDLGARGRLPGPGRGPGATARASVAR